LVAIISLALGIGANTAIFQLLDAVRLRALPVKSPEQLVELRIGDMTHARGNWLRPHALTNPLWEQLRQRPHAFSEMFAWADEALDISGSRETRYARGVWVSGNLFDALGVRPILGRVFHEADDRRGCGLSGAVISYGFWQREFGGNASVIGRKINLNQSAVEVIGVTPPDFFGLEVGRQFDLALPICGAGERLNSGTTWWLTVMGRLKPDVTPAQADAQLQAISPGIFEATLPADYPPVSVKPYLAMRLNAIPAGGGFSNLREQYSTPLVLLLAIAGLVLLIACANLANLMLARAAAREREIAVRLAIGASRTQLIQQIMTEGLLLAIAGAVAALFLARELSRFLVSFLVSGDDWIFLDIRLDWRVFAFAASLAILTCLSFALAPALRSTRGQASDALKFGARGTTAGRERFGMRRILVAGQIALSLVLIVGALLFVRSLRNLTTLEPGFRENGILIATVDYGRAVPDSRLPFIRRDAVERVLAIPGVLDAAETASIPINGNAWTNIMWMDEADSSRGREISRSLVGAGYFRTIGTPLVAGREFDERDTHASQNVAVVSEEFVRRFSLGANPVGEKFWIEKTPYAPQIAVEIIGVAKNSKYSDLRQDFMPVAYFPLTQFPQPLRGGSILIRSDAPLDTLTPLIRRALADASPDVQYSFSVFKTRIEQSLLRERLMAILSGVFGALAVLLASVGLYGVISYTVVRRTNEIGIRIALGASRRSVIGLVLRETAVLLIAGLGVGIAISFAAGHAVASLLFGLQASDPLTLAVAGSVLAAVAMGASYFPAYRASTVDPMIALRAE